MEQNFYFVITNGGTTMPDQMEIIDEGFMTQIAKDGNVEINIILAISLACCVLVLLIATLLLPFQYRIQNAQALILDITCSMEQEEIAEIILKHKVFEQMLSQNINPSSGYFFRNLLQNSNLDGKAIDKEQLEKDNTPNKLVKQNSNKQKNSKQSKYQKKFQKEKQRTKHKKMKFEESKMENYLDESDEEKSEKVDQQRNHSDNLQYQSYSQEDNDPDSIQQQNYEKSLIMAQTFQNKIKIGLFYYGFATLMITLYVVTYILSKTTFSNFQEGFKQYNVFYTRVPCLTESLFFVQRTALFNETMISGSDNGDRIQNQFTACQTNENSYMQIKSNPSGMFKQIESQLNALDNDLCNYLDENEILNKTICTTTANGFLALGVSQIIQSILSQIQKIQIKYAANELIDNRAAMTDTFLKQIFYDTTTISQAVILYEYLLQVFQYTQDLAHVTLSNQMNTDFQKIIALFCVFLTLLIFFLIFVYHKVINWMKIKMIRIRLLLKLVPSFAIIKHKDKLAQLNTIQQ